MVSKPYLLISASQRLKITFHSLLDGLLVDLTVQQATSKRLKKPTTPDQQGLVELYKMTISPCVCAGFLWVPLPPLTMAILFI